MSLIGGTTSTTGTQTGPTLSSTSTAPVTFSGISSGLDTSGIIQKLMSLAQQPLTQMQNQQAALQSQQQTYAQINSNLTTLSTALSQLTSSTAFTPISASSSDSTVATISASSGGAGAGTYNLTVSQLAQAQKISSNPYADTTSSLGLSSGSFILNGKAVNVNSTDSLQSLASKINTLNVGVTASLINGGAGNAYITLASTTTGAANTIQIADLTGSAATTLGLVSGAASIRNAITNGAASSSFSSANTPLATLLGAPAGTTAQFQVNGSTSISVNLDTDTLQSVADKINATGAGVSASVQSSTQNGATTYQLQMTAAGGVTFTDTNDLMQGLGVLQQAPGTLLVKAQDAKYSLDSVNLTSASNTITSAIPGATFTLLKGSTATPASATLTLAQNTSAIDSAVNSFVSGFNGVNDFISQNSSFNTSTFASGPLFGDPVAEQVQSSLTNMVLGTVPGLTGSYNSLASLGFSLDGNGDLQVNTSVLNQALSANPSAVTSVFQAAGTSNTTGLSYVSSSAKSVPSGAAQYSVNVTKLSTQATFTAGTAPTDPSTSSENLTFTGSMFGSSNYVMSLPSGSTLSSIINQINSDSTLKNLVVASNNSGVLSVQSKLYGSQGNFNVVSSAAAATSNSGVGTLGQSTSQSGLDVAGTINGEAATGSGQFLTGKSGNKTTDGLQIQYSGNTLGQVGSVTFTNGIAAQLVNQVSGFTDPTNGLIATATGGLTKQISDIQTSITTLNTQLTAQQTNLQNEFNDMETAMAKFQQQSAQLTSMFSSFTSTSSG